MGQYWVPVCLNTNQKVEPHRYGEGAKLMEHSWIHTKFIRSVAGLLTEDGPWHKKHIAWVGDYTDDDLMLTPNCKECIEKKINYECPDFVKALVGECNGTYKQYYRGAKTIDPEEPNKRKLPLEHYILNHTKKLFVDTSKCPVEDESKKYKIKWVIYPLSLLTATSNGMGGGDYNGKNVDIVGTWMGDKISVELEKPKDFEELEPGFTEMESDW
jgi:hypothetical protein